MLQGRVDAVQTSTRSLELWDLSGKIIVDTECIELQVVKTT